MTVRYCGRDFSHKEIDSIKHLIAQVPTRNRAQLSRLTCQSLKWFKPDGGLKDMSARVAMLRMQEDGLIKLPPPLCKRPVPTVQLSSKTDPQELVEQPAGQLSPLRFERVVDKSSSRLWNEYIQRYHYLGHKLLPGAQLRYMIYSQNRLIALQGFGAAAWQTAPRDNYIGWSHEQRQKNLHLIVNNARFLILPWIKSHNLASMILAKVSSLLSDHWYEQYNYYPVLLETFVEKPRFEGTCYKAANWVFLGQTKGRGKLGPAGIQSVPIKDLLVYPLDNKFREILTA